MENIKISIENQVYEVDKFTTVLELVEKFNLPFKDPMGAVINSHFTRLTRKLRVDSKVEIIELSSAQGKKIYEASVLYLLVVAFHNLFPERKLFIQHSIQKGIYAEVQGKELSRKEVKQISDRMLKLVERKLPIERISQDWDVALDEMKEMDRQDILNLCQYYSPTNFKYYELEGVKESYYLPLAPNTKDLGHFSIEKYQDGMVVVLPDFAQSKEVPKFEDRPKLFKTYQEYHEWSRILKVRTVGQLNKYIMNDEINELVKVAEAFHEKRVAQIADEITNRKHVPRLISIAGPTSSGKTTFAKRLGVQLKVNGYRPVAVSMDNYFVDRDKTPKDEDGNYDFETLDAIDVPLFVEHITGLLNGEEVELPKFDFISGTKKGSGKTLKLDADQLIIIEGIHGINPKLTSTIAAKEKYKIYIAPLTQLNLHRHDRIPASDTRLIRRMVRDSFFRGYSASDTLGRWRSVRRGEKKNIFPLQEEADVVFNSALFYELSVLKGHAERELLKVSRDDPMYSEAQRLMKFLSYFLPLHTDEIPPTSILKEFVGGSSFHY